MSGSGSESWRFARAFSPGKSALVVDDFSRIVHRPDTSAIVLAHPDHFEPASIAAARWLTDAAASAWRAGASMDDVFALVPPPAKYSVTSLLVVAISANYLHARKIGAVSAWLTDGARVLEGTGDVEEIDQIWRAPPRTRLVCGNYVDHRGHRPAEVPTIVVSAERGAPRVANGAIFPS